MGQRRVQLGCNVVATALPAGEGGDSAQQQQPEDVVLYFGIIDILQARCCTPSSCASLAGLLHVSMHHPPCL
jgi:hypothetical protein